MSTEGDAIELRGLRLVAVVGVLTEERTRAQPLEVDLDLHLDLSTAGESDDLTDTVDYGAVCDTTARVCETEQPQLLERLAQRVADAVLDMDTRLGAVTVAIRKLRPPVPHDLASSGVRVTRVRG